MEIFEIENGGLSTYRLALNFPAEGNIPGSFGHIYWIGEFDNNASYLPATEKIYKNSITTFDKYPKGMEFSPDGNYLYVTQRNTTPAIQYFDIANFTNGYTPLAVTNANHYDIGFIELGYDGKMYFAGTNKLGVLTNPNNPNSNNWYEFSVNTFPTVHYVNDYCNVRREIRLLPDQIDGYVYYNDYPTTECCVNINPFTKKIYTSTSSGTWTNGTFNNPFFVNNNVVTIKNELRIKSGNQVTIQGMVFKFGPQAKLIVEKGARLTLENTIFTSLDICGSDLMWQGIQVYGDYNLPQTLSSYQGFLIINNSTVENAMVAAANWQENNWASTGGVIKAKNSTFKNNRTDVVHRAYPNPLNPNVPKTNSSNYINCDFITSAKLNNPNISPWAHLDLYAVYNINIMGCRFINSVPNLYTTTARGRGINSFNATFKVQNYCTSFSLSCPPQNTITSSFENLWYGITASASSPIKTITVTNTSFLNNQRGIYMKNIDYATIIGSTFTVPSANIFFPPLMETYGLYTDNSTAYKIENNNFSALGPFALYGTYIKNSGAENNYLYRNNYQNLYVNVQAEGQNSDAGQYGKGLFIQCNTFTGNMAADVYISPTNTPLPGDGMIKNWQGSCEKSTTPANNLFTYSTGFDFLQHNNALPVTYHYTNDPSFNLQPRLGYYNQTNTTLAACNQQTNFIFSLSCPDQSNLGSLGDIKSNIQFAKQQAISLQGQVDGGDTQFLLNKTGSGISPGQLKSILLGASPYLSDTVLLSMLGKQPSLPAGTLKEILLANAPLSAAVYAAVQGMQPPLPGGILGQIAAAQNCNCISQYQYLLGDISYWNGEAAYYENELIRYWLNDTTTTLSGIDTVIAILRQQNQYQSKIILAEALAANGEHAEAQQLVDSIRIANPYLEEVCRLIEIQMQIDSSIANCTLLIADTALATEVSDIAQPIVPPPFPHRACGRAQAWLEFVFNMPFPETFEPLPNNNLRIAQEQNEEDKLVMLQNDVQVNIYPNPAKGMFTVACVLPEGQSLPVIEIHEPASGRVVYSGVMQSQTEQINIQHLAAGMYILQLRTKTERIAIKKLVVY